MKIVINTNYKAAGTKVCVDDLGLKLIKMGHKVTHNDWVNYKNYDLILFMAPDSEVEKAKEINPGAITGIMDPKLSWRRQIRESQLADFLLVSSIEQRDTFLKYNKNVFVYYQFPEIKEICKSHVDREKIVIGYHGNKLHLNCMIDLSNALDELSKKYNVEFWAMYNIKKLGRWRKNLPKKCPVNHIQWLEENYSKYLSQCDIGVVPAKIPINTVRGRIMSRFFDTFIPKNNWAGYNKNDYLVRFKYSTNPGRVYVFSQLSIPVVADFMPSYCQIIRDGYSGYLVYSKEGWYDTLERLINSSKLRNEMSKNLKAFIDKICSPDINFKNFLDFINSIKDIKE